MKDIKLDLRMSITMSKTNQLHKGTEDKLIRIPEELRDKLGIKTGLFLYLKKKDGGTIPLQVSKAYIEDAEKGNYAFVSNNIYRLLYTEKNQKVVPIHNILIGCDPEFFIVDESTNKNVSASNFFPDDGVVGNDCGLAEIRPSPSNNVDELLFNVKTLLQDANDTINNRTLYRNKDFRMVASSYRERVGAGFHLHFGLPPEILTEEDVVTEALRHRMVTVLDYYLGILIVIPEGAEDSKRRAHTTNPYGKPGDFRYNYLTFEYRVPGGHILRHPLLTRGLFAIGKLTMTDLLGRVKIASDNFKDVSLLKNYESMKSLYPKLPDRSEVYKTITKKETNTAISFIDSILEDIRQMNNFSEFEEPIEEYINYIKEYSSKGHRFSENIVHNWRLSNEVQSKKMAVYKSSN